jgi:hypothetical protein
VAKLKIGGVFSNESYALRDVRKHPTIEDLKKNGRIFGYHSSEDFVSSFGINPVPDLAFPPQGDFFYVRPEMIGLGRVVDKVMLGSRQDEVSLNGLVEDGVEVFGTLAIEDGTTSLASNSAPIAKSTVGSTGASVDYDFVIKDKKQPFIDTPISFFARHPKSKRFMELTPDRLELLEQAKRMGKDYGGSLDRSKLSGEKEALESSERDISLQGFTEGETQASEAIRKQFLNEVKSRRNYKYKADPLDDLFSEFSIDDPSSRMPNRLDGDIDEEWLHLAFNSGASIAATPKGQEMTRAIGYQKRNTEIARIAKESGLSKSEARRELQEREFKEKVERLRSEGKIDHSED